LIGLVISLPFHNFRKKGKIYKIKNLVFNFNLNLKIAKLCNQAFLRSFGNPVANLTKSALLYFNDY